ncbi:MAG TPA: hypothetical protein P5105_02450 [Victivallales bacterium]|nr:hypothetical protein [Victivallales bacterium]HPO90756.1 hypothetical protein [Victivallales bacterium]HRR06120.1 hypothetical protein [Victivallales bacterium]HRU01084.1 hypothetical protein [Victivallales bacterium]
MNKSTIINRIILIVLFLIVCFFIASYLFPNDKEKIKKQFANLASAVSIIPGEKPIQIGLKMTTMPELFDNPCEIEATHEWINGSYTPQEISSQIMRAKMNFKSLSLTFYDISIELRDDFAVVNFTARLTATKKDNKSIEEVREVKADLRRKEKKWVFTKFAVVETLKK